MDENKWGTGGGAQGAGRNEPPAAGEKRCNNSRWMLLKGIEMNMPLTIYATLVVIVLGCNMALHAYAAWMPTKTPPATTEELVLLSNALAARNASAEFLTR